MNFEELQDKARLLGVNFENIGKKQLEKIVAQAEANHKVSTESDVKKSDEANTAVVLTKPRGGQEIRRYTLSLHGENFIELAKQFANDREYVVQLKQVKPGVPCPSCGYVIYPDEE